MGILWSLCCKDGAEPMGPTHTQKKASARLSKQHQQQGPPPPSWGPPPTPKDGSKRSKLLESGDGSTTSYNSVNGTGPPPKFSPLPDKSRPDRDTKRTSWGRAHTLHGPGDPGYVSPSSPPSSPRDGKVGGGVLGRTFSLNVGKPGASDKGKRARGSFRLAKNK